MPQATVLIVSDDPDFARVLTQRWQRERQVPSFVLIARNASRACELGRFELAIIDSTSPSDTAWRGSLLQIFDAAKKPTLSVEDRTRPNQAGRGGSDRHSAVTRSEDWIENTILLGSAMLERGELEARLRQLEEVHQTATAQATLGRFILEMRHTIGNSLTSVLGNAELLLAEPAILSASARFKVETIRYMGLRLNEIMQRFSSLQAEMAIVERHDESCKAQAASQGG